MAELRKTPLNDVHRESGAKMVPFGGWDMPVEYSGLIAEHNAVRTAAGLFDVSHMGQFEVEGEGALAFLQRVTANNVAKLVDGQAQYSALPMPTGCPVDDVIVYRRSARRFLVVVNAANIEKDWQWLLAQQPAGCGLHDLSDQFALLALQGPKAAAILQGADPDRPRDRRLLPLRRGTRGRCRGHRGPDGLHRRGRLRGLRRPRGRPGPVARDRRGGPIRTGCCPRAWGRATPCASRPG